MNIKKYSIDFALTFVVVLVVSIIVTFLYSLIAHGEGAVDLETAFRLAIILGIVLPWVHQREHKNKTTVS
jgi:uncharacterized membrane protein YadS